MSLVLFFFLFLWQNYICISGQTCISSSVCKVRASESPNCSHL